MHELSIAHSILSIAENAVPKNSKAIVTGVGIQVGELSGIEIESLQFAFSILKTNSLLQNAELNIRVLKGEAECLECHTIFPLSSYGTCCPQCKSYAIKILSGREMQVLNIVMDE